MKTCKWCNVEPNTKFKLKPTLVTCGKCQTDISHLFPREAIYIGRSNGMHLVSYVDPTVCPNCGIQCIKGAWDCPAELHILQLS